MKHETAIVLAPQLLRILKELDDCVRVMSEQCEEIECKRYRHSLAHAMADVSYEVLDEILKEHPDLAPPGYFDIDKPPSQPS